VSEVVTKSEFARRLDVDPAAVSLWISRQKLTAPALRDDGMLDVDLAVEQLRQRLEHARSSTDLGRAASSALDDVPGDDAPAPPSATAALIERQRQQRVEESDLRLRRLRRAELETAGQLVRSDAITAVHARAVEELLQAIEQWLPDLAVRLGAGREGIDIARREWRAFRQHQAEIAAAGAAELPAYEAADGR
jgi:hypothetical protein